MFPKIVAAQEGTQIAAQEAASFVETFNQVILFPTIALLTGVALLVFIWGCFEYFINAANPAGREKGVKHITWGIIGLVIMVSAYSILALFARSVGLDDELNCTSNPTASGCADVFVIPSSGDQTGGNSGGQTGGNSGGQTGGNSGG